MCLSDIKPANFVMGHESDADRTRVVHILDFGMARSVLYFWMYSYI